MLYINDPKQPHYKYDDLIKLVVKSGIDPKRAYMYLAAVGVKGGMARVLLGGDYGEPEKMAVFSKNRLVTSVDTCTGCKGLVIK